MSLLLPQSSESAEQQEILDALPVLVFLERAGKVVFANAEARQLIGVDAASGGRHFLGALVRNGRAAHGAYRDAPRQPVSRHAHGQRWPPAAH